MRIRIIVLALGAAVAITVALGGRESTEVVPTVELGPVKTVFHPPYLTVANTSQAEIAVWLFAPDGGRRRRLGSVRGLATETFELSPREHAVRLALQERSGGGQAFVTPAVTIGPRTLVSIQVASRLHSSHVVVSELDALGCCGDAKQVREQLRADGGS